MRRRHELPTRPGRPRRGRGDGGLAIVEMAVVAPLLALIVAGIVEFGTAWRDDLTVTNATRAAARVVSNLGDSREADAEALETLRAGVAGMEGVTIEGVLIFEATAADGGPSPSCFDAGGDPTGDAAGNCNYYTASQLETLTGADFTDPNCAGDPDQNFCPTTERETDQSVGVTPIGVWLRVEREWYTGVFPGTGFTITDRTVMNVEPES